MTKVICCIILAAIPAIISFVVYATERDFKRIEREVEEFYREEDLMNDMKAMYRGKNIYHVESLGTFSKDLFEIGSILHSCDDDSYYIKTVTGYVPLDTSVFANPVMLSQIDCNESSQSCKCDYCGCTNDHIYGTCDYCGAPLEG